MSKVLPIDPKSVVAAFDRHRASPHVSFMEHVHGAQLALAVDLRGRSAVYLDTKYWIILRNAIIGATARVDGTELLSRLRDLVAAGSAFCPISESTFAELFKQADQKTRRATATLMDELSLGVTLVPFYDRIALELKYLIETRLGRANCPCEDLVWVKTCYTLGLTHQVGTPFDVATERVIQKAFFDYLWTVSMREVVDQIGDSQLPNLNTFDALAMRLNAETQDHVHELVSFAQTYEIETAGVAEAIAPIAAQLATEIAERTSARAMPHDGPHWEELLAFWRAYLPQALKTDEGKDTLRTLHINASLHASLRWNKRQQFRGNDIYDFHHAGAAVGYCDIFLTERALKALLTSSHVALDKRYDCEVVATIDDALTALGRLGP